MLCRYSYKDWLDKDIRQILIETHDVPSALRVIQWKNLLLPLVNASDFFDAFEANGFAMFSKEANVYSNGVCYEWSFVKLSRDFFRQKKTG